MKFVQIFTVLVCLIVCCCNIVDANTEPKVFVDRQRRAARSRVSLSLINRSDRTIEVFYMTRGHQRSYFTRLRVNEKTYVDSFMGTTWLAYGENDKAMLLNQKYNFLVLPKYENIKERIEVVVTAHPSYAKVKSNNQLQDAYIEVFIVADATMYHHYQTIDTTRKYINALMNTVNQIFRDKSLDITFNVVVKKIEIWKQNITALNIPSNRPRQAVKMACNHIFGRKRKTRIEFDFGITLTRRRFGYSGYTPLYRMCVEYKSCTLIQDQGLHTAFIVAHEIAHSIGISHDGEHNECQNNAVQGSIMSPTVYSRFDNYHWSNCTKTQLVQNIRHFDCIKNIPPEFKGVETKLPGEDFNIDDHCKYYMGKGHTSCLGLRAPDQHCKYIFCRLPGRRRKLCSYWSLPPVDGTKCAENKWCIRGQCLTHGKYQPEPIDGQWSKWSEWSGCTHTCGRGIKTRERSCNNPKPDFNGENCVGDSKDWKICSRQVCSMQHVFSDNRDDICYQKFGENWKYFTKAHAQIAISRWKLNCTFEEGQCDWLSHEQEKQRWQINNGSTSTEKTGPSFDQTFQNETGKYLYLESSYPMRKGDSVLLTSPYIFLPKVCLHFAFHMYGDRLGSLRVLVKPIGGKATDIWHKSRHQGNTWHKARVTIVEDVAFKIILEGIRGSSYLSDIAIDDLFVTNGNCNQEADEENQCSLSCRSIESKKYKLNKVIPDGVKCRPDSDDICVFGKCQQLGCDGVTNSTLTMDECGVCGGKNTTCFHSYATLKLLPEAITSKVIRLPKYSMHGIIEKLTSGHGSMALADPQNLIEKFHYATPSVTYPWHYYKMAASVVRYQVNRNETSKIFIDNKITEDLEIQMLYSNADYNKSIPMLFKFSFYAPYKTKDRKYALRIDEWETCSKPCNSGVQSPIYLCINLQNNQTSTMANCLLPGVSVVTYKRPCNVGKCAISYLVKASKWSKCSACGKIGVRKRRVECIKKKEGVKDVSVEMKYCTQLPIYNTKKKCFIFCPARSVSKCNERSKSCSRMLAKGYCKYDSVKTLCCKTCNLSPVSAKI